MSEDDEIREQALDIARRHTHECGKGVCRVCAATVPCVEAQTALIVLRQDDEIDRLRAERDRFRTHSMRLHQVGWRLGVALGEINEAQGFGDDDIEVFVDKAIAAIEAAGGDDE